MISSQGVKKRSPAEQQEGPSLSVLLISDDAHRVATY